jgi:hypothetical protein
MTKKTLFLMLALIIMSAASVNAQVRIGGLEDPNPSAVLDLNATDATDNGTLGLALPRVALTSTSEAVKKGMIVYNTATAGDVTPGMYYNDGSEWIRIGTSVSEQNEVIGNVITDATAGGGLVKAGSGTTLTPYTLGIADGGVTADKLDAMSATRGQVLVYNGSTWTPITLPVAYCSGAIVFNGAYNGPTEGIYAPGFEGSFVANWTREVFTPLGRDLCWAKTDTGATSWYQAKSACEALTTDNYYWRLPNLKELQVLYEALGRSGEGSINSIPFSVLDASGKGVSGDVTEDMQASFYWSSTEVSSDEAYRFSFDYGIRSNPPKYPNSYVRCVRSL